MTNTHSPRHNPPPLAFFPRRRPLATEPPHLPTAAALSLPPPTLSRPRSPPRLPLPSLSQDSPSYDRVAEFFVLLVVWIVTFFSGDRWGNLAGLILVFFLAIFDAKGKLRKLIKYTREGGLKVVRRLRGKVAGAPVSVD